MKQIDFSKKHDVLIKNKDGSLRPMDEPYYEVYDEGCGVYRIGSDGDFHYLVIGEDEAVAVDTGYGAGNTRQFLQTLTDKPVKNVLNTHYHFDHTANNVYFDNAYMTVESIPLASVPYPSFDGIEIPRDYSKIIIREGDRIELGGRSLEVYEMGCHAVGSVVFLDRKNRILFTGDEFGHYCNISGSIKKFVKNMEKILTIRSEFDFCYGGHGKFDASYVERCLALGRDILAGSIDLMNQPARRHREEKKSINVCEDVTVYERFSPRPGDKPKKGEFNVLVTGHGVKISYDTRNINETKVYLG